MIKVSKPEEIFERKSEKCHTVNTGGSLLGTNFLTKSPSNGASSHLIKSPKLNSKFAPSEAISNSPTVRNKSPVNPPSNEKPMKITITGPTNTNFEYKSPNRKDKTELDTKVVPIVKKANNLLTNIDDINKKSIVKEKHIYSDDVEIKMVVKNDKGLNKSLGALQEAVKNE